MSWDYQTNLFDIVSFETQVRSVSSICWLDDVIASDMNPSYSSFITPWRSINVTLIRLILSNIEAADTT